MSLVGHLEELRWRILWSLFYWIIACFIVWGLVPRIIDFCTPLLKGANLIFTSPTEAFFAYMNAAMVGGACLASPIFLYHILMFVLPGLEKGERKWVYRLLPLSIFQFLLGCTFAIKLVLPGTMDFFMGFATGKLIPQIKIGEFIGFITTITIICGIIFELPIVLMFLAGINLITSKFLARHRRMAYFLAFVISAVATPTPDAFTATVVALPILINYEVSLFLIRLCGK
jgi:sec-independent protein translocase protein TatC